MNIKKCLLLIIPLISLVGCKRESAERKVYLNYGNNIVIAENVKLDEEYTAPSDIVTEGYKFEGWFLNPAYTSFMQASFPMKIVDDVYLYAKYSIKYFNVTYDLNGNGILKSITRSIQWGQKITYLDPSVLLKSGKTFVGWYEEEACENEWDFDTQIYESTTIYAKCS